MKRSKLIAAFPWRNFYKNGELSRKDMKEVLHPFVEESMQLFAGLLDTGDQRSFYSFQSIPTPYAKRIFRKRRGFCKKGFAVAEEWIDNSVVACLFSISDLQGIDRKILVIKTIPAGYYLFSISPIPSAHFAEIEQLGSGQFPTRYFCYLGYFNLASRICFPACLWIASTEFCSVDTASNIVATPLHEKEFVFRVVVSTWSVLHWTVNSFIRVYSRNDLSGQIFDQDNILCIQSLQVPGRDFIVSIAVNDKYLVFGLKVSEWKALLL